MSHHKQAFAYQGSKALQGLHEGMCVCVCPVSPLSFSASPASENSTLTKDVLNVFLCLPRWWKLLSEDDIYKHFPPLRLC